MNVFLKKSQLDYFRQKSRNSPNEQFAFLVGDVTKNGVEIAHFWYPRLAVSTPTQVTTEEEDDRTIAERASDEGLSVVGSIHSHPDCPPIMSETDFTGHISGGDWVTGIVSVNQRKTYVCFWSAHSALPCEFTYI
jgi:proteasome lid subunit RPN8/RPN11